VALHVKPQTPPVQVGVEFAGCVQGVHDAPQLFVEVLSAHAVPHVWKPELHVNPQLVPLHVDVPFAGGVHGEQPVPQLLMEVLSAHAAPHAW
jgi:hypothetical protein